MRVLFHLTGFSLSSSEAVSSMESGFRHLAMRLIVNISLSEACASLKPGLRRRDTQPKG
jgi:hypothetical protein